MRKKQLQRKDIPPHILTDEESDKLIELASLFSDDSNDSLTVGEKALDIISQEELVALQEKLEDVDEDYW